MLGPLLDNPHRVGGALRRELEGLHSARRGAYRSSTASTSQPASWSSSASTTAQRSTDRNDRARRACPQAPAGRPADRVLNRRHWSPPGPAVRLSAAVAVSERAPARARSVWPLLGANLSPRIATVLGEAGHDVVHVLDIGLADATDVVILDHAAAEHAYVVSSDTDFGALLARQRRADRSADRSIAEFVGRRPPARRTPRLPPSVSVGSDRVMEVCHTNEVMHPSRRRAILCTTMHRAHERGIVVA